MVRFTRIRIISLLMFTLCSIKGSTQLQPLQTHVEVQSSSSTAISIPTDHDQVSNVLAEPLKITLDENVYNHCLGLLLKDSSDVPKCKKTKAFTLGTMIGILQSGGLLYTNIRFTTEFLWDVLSGNDLFLDCDNGFNSFCRPSQLPHYVSFKMSDPNRIIPLCISFFTGWSFLQKDAKDISRVMMIAKDLLKKKEINAKKIVCCVGVASLQGFVFLSTFLNLIKFNFAAYDSLDILAVGLGLLVFSECDNQIYTSMKEESDHKFLTYNLKIDEEKDKKCTILRSKNSLHGYDLACAVSLGSCFVGEVFSKVISRQAKTKTAYLGAKTLTVVPYVVFCSLNFLYPVVDFFKACCKKRARR